MPRTRDRLRAWLEAHPNEPICDACLAMSHVGHCERNIDLLPVEAKRVDKPIYDLRHEDGLDIKTENVICPRHNRRSHYRLVGHANATRHRASLVSKEREAVAGVYRRRDAFTTAWTARGQVDHRVPIIRTNGRETPVNFSDPSAIRQRYLWLSPEHNKLKNAQCKNCHKTGLRPPFLGIDWWFEGDRNWTEETGCRGCGWAFPDLWRERALAQLRAYKR